jgi:hypothetical protein
MLPKQTKNKPIIVSRCTCYRPPTNNWFLELLEQTFNKLISHCEQIIMLVAQLSANYFVNVSIRVHDISDAGIGSGIRVSSVGVGRRKKPVTFNICVESLNASPHELDLNVNRSSSNR